jgi:hypothetical protein
LAPIALIPLGASFEHVGTFHWNGQILVVPGGSDWHRERMGAWVYYDEYGALVHDETIDGVSYARTGFYDHGVRIRPVTDEELRVASEEAERLMAYHRSLSDK